MDDDWDEAELAEVLKWLPRYRDMTPDQDLVAELVSEYGRGVVDVPLKEVWDSIQKEHLHFRCERCEDFIPKCELLVAMESGLCSYCEHMVNKTRDE
jgi:hypothetical protein